MRKLFLLPVFTLVFFATAVAPPIAAPAQRLPISDSSFPRVNDCTGTGNFTPWTPSNQFMRIQGQEEVDCVGAWVLGQIPFQELNLGLKKQGWVVVWNLGGGGGYSTVLISENNELVGNFVFRNGDNGLELCVSYHIPEAYSLDELHLWVGTSPDQLPKNAAPGQFPFKSDNPPPSSTICTTPPGVVGPQPVYVAIHAKVCARPSLNERFLARVWKETEGVHPHI